MSSRPQLPSVKIGVVILPCASKRSTVIHLSVCHAPALVLGAKGSRRSDRSVKDRAAGAVGGSQHQTGPGRSAGPSQAVWERGVTQTSGVPVRRAPSIPEACTARPLCPGHSPRSFEETHSPHPQGENWHSIMGVINVHK